MAARTYSHDGKTMTLPEWADHLCVPYPTLTRRLRLGLDLDLVFTVADHTPHHRITAFGETHTLAEWSRRTGINARTILTRLQAGENAESALTRQKQMGQVIRATDKRLDGEHIKEVRRRKREERERLRAERASAEQRQADRRHAEERRAERQEQDEAKARLEASAAHNREERERAKTIAAANAERAKAHASRTQISAESMALIERARINAKAKAEEERARIMAIEIKDAPIYCPATPEGVRKRPRKPVDRGYQPVNDGLFGAFAKGAGEVRRSIEGSGTGVGSLARETAELGLFKCDR